MTTMERREQILQAEKAITDLERRATDYVTASTAIAGAQEALESACAELSTTGENVVQFTKSTETCVAGLRAAEEDLRAACRHLSTLGDQIEKQEQKYSDQITTHFYDIEKQNRATTDDLTRAFEKSTSAIQDRAETSRRDLENSIRSVVDRMEKYDQKAAERAREQAVAMDSIRKALYAAIATGGATLVLLIAALIFMYVKLR